MQRLAVRFLTAAALIGGTVVSVTPAQATAACDQRFVNNGYYNYCWGEPYPRQYRSEVWCANDNTPSRKVFTPGPWRYYGTGNASVARCDAGWHRYNYALNFS